MAKFQSEEYPDVSAGAAAAVLASVTEVEEGNDPLWRPDDECASQVLIGTISRPSARSAPGNDGQRFAHLQSIIHNDIGREEFGRGMTVFRGRIVDELDAFTPEF